MAYKRAKLDNERFILDPNNIWGSDAKIAPYLTVPSWWRRFIFQVLSARDFTVYAYIVSVCDKNGIAYPSPEQIASDMNIKSRVIVNRAIENLVELGFLTQGAERVRIRRNTKRVVFQRPRAAYTLLRLLEKGLINGDLYPADVSEDAIELDFSQSAVEAGLKNMLSTDAFSRYEASADKTETLTQLLNEDLERRAA